MTSSNNLPWESNNGGLHNASQMLRNSSVIPNGISPIPGRTNVPVLPPRPPNSLASPAGGSLFGGSPYGNSYLYSGNVGSAYSPYGSFGSYSMPYRSSMYNSYGNYGSSFNTGYGGGFGSSMYAQDDSERRFIQYAEESSRNTFASVESIVRAFNSIAMMLDNTFFAMTSSFRAVLSVAENFGRLRSMFGHIWYSINIFRFITWLYRKLRMVLGLKVSKSATSLAWTEATAQSPVLPDGSTGPQSSSWPTLAFLGVLVSAPYIISKFLPKYEDKSDPATWKAPGVRAKACFDFIGTTPGELTLRTNDIILLAPTHVQEEMNLKNSGWAFAVLNGKSGVVPLNYLVISKNRPISSNMEQVPVPRVFPTGSNSGDGHKTPSTKRVSFGDIQIFENTDDNVKKVITSQISDVDNRPLLNSSKGDETVDKGKGSEVGSGSDVVSE